MPTAPILVRNAGGLDVLAALPAMLGFYPQDSVVIAGILPPRGRLGLVLRVDLADQAGPAGRAAVRSNMQRMQSSGAVAVFVVRYASSTAVELGQDLGFGEMLREAREVVDVTGLWDVRPDRLQEYDPITSEPIGAPYSPDDLKSTQGAAAAAAAGLVPRPQRADLAKIIDAPIPVRRATRRAERRAWDQALALSGPELGRWRVVGLAAWRLWLAKAVAAPASTVLPPNVAGKVNALLGDGAGRDAIILTAFRDADDAPRRAALGLGSDELLDPFTSLGVDTELSDAAIGLTRQMLSYLAPQRRGGGYAIGACWYWWNGQGAEASEWARAGMECDNAPPLARLVAAMVEQGIFPDAVTQLRDG
ncbi:MAG: DUF4192 domain-containing protein [Bifidobacteriaceae bacterium]|jgi:hypothetical protein|nr:DUF4192 domain-containing protein [Bifidobacteriaceae bacterium]